MCENCNELFDVKTNSPYIIPCGHTICEKCLNSFDFTDNKLKCPIDSRIYEVTKEKIPKNEILIDYILSNKRGPKYTYQIREYNLKEATFSYVDRRNCFQKIFRFLYKLFYEKIFLTIIGIIFWPFIKIYQLIKMFLNLMRYLYLTIKKFLGKIYKKIKSIKFPKIQTYFSCFFKMKYRLLHLKLIKAIINFFKYTVRAPLWINYLKLMKHLLYKSQEKIQNKYFKLMAIIVALMGIILAHLVAYFTKNLEFFFIILLLLNESTIVLIDFMKMDNEKNDKKYIHKNKMQLQSKRKSAFTFGQYKSTKIIDEEDEDYLLDKKKHKRGKKCITRWIGFIFFWYFFPMIKEYILDFIKYRAHMSNIDFNDQETKIKIWTGVVNSLLFIPKLSIVVYLTS